MNKPPMPDILEKLLKISIHSDFNPRWRLAVSSAEMEEIESYCLAAYGESWRRIRGIPLVVENSPEFPELFVVK